MYLAISFLESSIGVYVILSVVFFNQIVKLKYRQTIFVYFSIIILMILVGLSYGFDRGVVFSISVLVVLELFIFLIRTKW